MLAGRDFRVFFMMIFSSYDWVGVIRIGRPA
jgi:hypothetical protein